MCLYYFFLKTHDWDKLVISLRRENKKIYNQNTRTWNLEFSIPRIFKIVCLQRWPSIMENCDFKLIVQAKGSMFTEIYGVKISDRI